MKSYSTIKELVLDAYVSEGSMPSYEKLTSLVRQFFPQSRWQQSHYAWYKSQIRTGKIPVPGGKPKTAPDEDESEITTDVEESLEARISLERDLQDYLAARLETLEPGLTLYEGGVEYPTDAGRIDILTIDADGQSVVVEIKAGKARDSALGQLLGYMGCVSDPGTIKGQVRGILVAAEFDKRVVFACKNLPNIKLLKYNLSFSFSEVT